MDALGVDVVGLSNPNAMFGYPLADWKAWTFFDGTPVLVPGGFNTQPEPNGDILMYPEGDTSAPPSGRMPSGGFYFDAIVRQPEFDEDHLDPADNCEEFQPVSEADLDFYERKRNVSSPILTGLSSPISAAPASATLRWSPPYS